MDSAVLIWGGVPSHLPSPVSAHIPAGPTEGRHLGVSTGGPGGPPALACCLEPSPCGCLGAEGSGCALLCLGLGSPHGLGVSVSRPVSRSPCTAPQYFTLLLVIFLLEIIAGALAYVYYQQLNAELKENLKDTMTKRYHQLGHEGVTSAVDKLQQEFHCCGSNNSQDWRDSEWIRSGEAGGRVVPDSCCKTVVAGCGQRDHASNIYKVEGGCITKLETFIQEHLRIIGAVGLGIACVQVFGVIFTCCLYKSLKLEHY
ncbi:CD151 antigen isoform X2 [Phocoena sinus]|uniref:CD151 molecule (Raph blood group) n=1 Tax=Phocoena sinus TaxID=42100 RepID=A0A8C9BJ20_PHOSS|nr:CD151 antigen isoform X2 [Phocoena sinus]